MNFQGFAGFRIIKKLQSLNGIIKAWNGEVFGNIESSRNSVSKQLDDWDLKEEVRGLNQDERAARGVVVKRLWDLNRMEEIMWR